MDIGSIFLILALLIPVIIFVSRPLLDRSSKQTRTPPGQDISALLANRDQAIAALQELDDDYHLGKIPEESYPAQRQTLLQNGADILRQIDAVQLSGSGATPEDRLEAAIAAHRQAQSGAQAAPRKNGNGVPPVPDDNLEQKIAARRRLRQGKAGGFCPHCGKPVQEVDKFCPRCGTPLS